MVALFPTPTLDQFIGVAHSLNSIASIVETLLKLTEYGCAKDRYQALVALSMLTTPPPVVVKSYLEATVA